MLAHRQPTPSRDDLPDVKGLRDYALLLMWLHTGRDRLDIAALRCNHLQIEGDNVIVSWRGRAKNSVRLPALVSEALIRYLRALHGPALDLVPADTPVWVRLRGNRGEMLSIEMIDAVYRQYRRTQAASAALPPPQVHVFGD